MNQGSNGISNFASSDNLESIKIHNEIGSDLASSLELDELEGLVYLHLLKVGPITASTLSREVGIERTKTYRIVEKLTNEGMISITFSNPKLCVPLDPDEAFNKILKKKEEEIKRIKKSRKNIIRRVRGIITSNYYTSLPTFRIIQGQHMIYSNIEKILDDAKDVTYIVTSSEDIAKMYHSNIPEKIKKCEERQVEVRLILDVINVDVMTFVTRLNISKVRKGETPSKGRIIVSKENQMLMSDSARVGNNLDNESDFALLTNSPDMVNNIFKLCMFMWDSSKM